VVTFKYDPFGRRIEKISPTTTSIFAYDGDNLVETVNSSGSLIARYTLGRYTDEPLAMQRGSRTDYYEADGLGSITSLSSASGSLAQTYTYGSFGNTTNSSGSLTNFFRYTAREFDTETNLYFYRPRYYDPVVGRFISEDPLEFESGNDNLYVYVGNRVLNLEDPSGLCPVPCHCGCKSCHTVNMLVTGYDNSYQSTGKNPGDPGYGETAHQTQAGPGTIAAPRTYKFNTKMFVPGYGCGSVQDRGGAIKGNHIDVWFSTTQQALNWGRPHVSVEVCDDSN
jgi:RHS repeat-associated protein